MLLAFGWWSVLLYTKNRDAYNAKVELLRIGLAAEQKYTDEATFRANGDFIHLTHKYESQEKMILGEVLVFIASLITGIWLINKSYNKEIQVEQQRSNFLLSITHELKSPLSSIQLILETFHNRTLQQEQVQKLSLSGMEECKRLNQLINNLLMAARVEEAYKPVYEPIALAPLIRQLVLPIQQNHPELDINLDVDADLPFVQADHLGISIVFQNLIENAIKYAGFDNPVSIQLRKTNSHYVEIIFEDQGPGIADNEKKNVFDRFYRIGSEETRKTKGTGLGLYIVKKIVEAHKGTIQLYDAEPQGLGIRIQIPV
ncbi:MAG: ATP-binding protein [Saprospiraceae bacterium]